MLKRGVKIRSLAKFDVIYYSSFIIPRHPHVNRVSMVMVHGIPGWSVAGFQLRQRERDHN